MHDIPNVNEDTVQRFMNGACHHLALAIAHKAPAGVTVRLCAVANFYGLSANARPSFAWLLRNGRIDHIVAEINGFFADASGVYESLGEITIAHDWAGGENETYIIPLPRGAMKRIAADEFWSKDVPDNTEAVASAVLDAALSGRLQQAA
jgi:hypothetical protein